MSLFLTALPPGMQLPAGLGGLAGLPPVSLAGGLPGGLGLLAGPGLEGQARLTSFPHKS